MSRLRWGVFIVWVAVLAIGGVLLLAARGGEEQSRSDLVDAEDALRQGDTRRATDLARAVLEREPASGRAFGVLARAGEHQAADDAARARYQVAARRAPRDVGVRRWLASDALASGDFAAAVDHLDAVLTIDPAQRVPLVKLLVELARDPAFADTLAVHLAREPKWRPAILRAAAAGPEPGAADNLHAALRAHGGLSDDEVARWIDGMLRDGRWGSAYARWVSGLAEPPQQLQAPWNGDFRRSPSSAGFDWRVRRTAGVLFDRVPLAGDRHAARLRFLGRPVARTGLEVPLLLAPGEYRLRLSARAPGLRSDQGLEWSLACGDGRTAIATGARMRNVPDWTEFDMHFVVPATQGCEGQWLRLVNPAPAGVAQILRGELLVTDVVIEP